MCRRAHGAGFVTWFAVPPEQVSFEQGESELVRFDSSSHGARSFCGRCGSTLFCDSSKHPNRLDIVLANMEGPIDLRPQLHTYFDDRADWVEVNDTLPRLGGGSGLEPSLPSGDSEADPSGDPASVVAEYFSRMRAGDVSVVELFDEDACLVGLGTKRSGRSAIREFYEGVIERAGPTPRSLGPLLAEGSRVAAEIGIDLAAGGTIHAVDVFEVEGGRIRSLTYFLCNQPAGSQG